MLLRSVMVCGGKVTEKASMLMLKMIYGYLRKSGCFLPGQEKIAEKAPLTSSEWGV
jgi:hypothetical protein